MKRLYMVVDRHTKKKVTADNGEVQYFNNKDAAKTVRNAQNAEAKSIGFRFYVTLGPDHVKFTR